MYLKSIEIQGFKSFANKMVFQFHNGITAIVGPNGSGKSNVADAVRWVLGEQRIKQLRGASMQDVIFAGTELRKPLSFAYVAITLDNSDHQLAIDYDEVTVARRIYRSGESEYLINGTACRLKDVNELFYDTGIGKEGYSIIGQGQIDKILSGKPEERRELFDEAAGIVKFKRRKDTACKKLDEEKTNLVRVNDILSEVEKQIEPLEKQAETAKIYLKKKEELKSLDVNVFLLENERVTKQLGIVEENYKIAADDLEHTTQEYENIKSEYEQIQNTVEMLEQEIGQIRGSLSTTSVTRGKLEGEINVLKEQIRSAQGNAMHLNNRMETLGGEIAEREREKEAILAEKGKIDLEMSEIECAAKEAKQLLEQVQNKIEQLNEQIEQGKNTIIDELNKRASIKSRVGRYDTMLEQVNIRKAELNSRLLRAKSDEAKQEETIRELEDNYARISSEMAQMDADVAQMEQQLGQFKDILTQKDEKLRRCQEAFHQEKSKLEAVSNLAERYEGYGGSVKKVMEQKDSHKGIVGVVADIIKVDKEYEVAIETALGGNIQNIVTEEEETAKQMIEFLKKNRLGRATFLPLTAIKNSPELKTRAVLDETGVIGMADELVHIDRKYQDVAKAMLGRIVVVDSVDHAVKIARKYEYTIRMVTLEGELLVPGGAISGGAFKNNSNFLGRYREMEELKKKIAEYEKQIQCINQEIEQTKSDRNKMRIRIESARLKLQQKMIEQNTARICVEQAQERRAETAEGSISLRSEQEEIEKQMIEIQANKENINQELSDSEKLEKEITVAIGEYQIQMENLREEEASQSARVSEWELATQKMRQKQDFEQQNVNRIDGELLRLTKEKAEVEEGISLSSDDVERKKRDIEQIEKTIEASYQTQSAEEQKLKEDIEQKDQLTGKQRGFFQIREAMAEKITSLDKEVYRLNAQKEKLEESVESQINYMWDEYEITLSDAGELRDPQMTDLSGMKREISGLKDQIRRLGDVNVNAIEDYKNLMERYGFLRTQHDDLVEAEATLQGIIDELDAAMRKQFIEKFSDINKEFDKVFKELFGGGKGTLELMEEEDILEAGICISAQPPGKKLQNMMQMSGGEKALTAIALLFAIQNLKPSPFCLLDEIEAALDEANVDRYAKYLHKLTKSTQFIVITHRRGTMESADRLYGITMQEKGVSTLVSVSLIDKELTD